jgi:hypothetical protein
MDATIDRVAEFGDFIVYRRARWPVVGLGGRYFVTQESNGYILEEFRRRASAVKWARAQRQPQPA